MQRLALTSVGPYVGTTTLAKWLAENKGYMHISMSRVLIEAFINDRGYSRETVDTVIANKAVFRSDLQRFGESSGFDTDPAWVEKCLAPWVAAGKPPVVIEKVRTDTQATALRRAGFAVIELAIKAETQRARAMAMGVSPEKLAEMMSHEVEQGIDERLVHSIIVAEGPVGVYGSWLVNERPNYAN